MSNTVPLQEWVWLARIRRPQGRKGEVFADVLTDFPEKFAERKRLWLIAEDSDSGHVTGHDLGSAAQSANGSEALAPAPRQIDLLHHWLHKGGVVLHFAGVDSISAAEALARLVVAIPREARAQLAEDEVYIGDLIGCILVDVRTNPAAPLGEIESVDRNAGPTPLLIVSSAQGEVLIPFAKSYLRKIDLENRRVEMALPEGLVDLNG